MGVYIFPLLLYRLSVLTLPKSLRLALEQSPSKLLWKGRRPMVRRQVCCQCPRNGALRMPHLESNQFTERLAFLGWLLSSDTVWKGKVKEIFPRLKSNPKIEGCHTLRSKTPFFCECHKAIHNIFGSSDFAQISKGTVLGFTGPPLRIFWKTRLPNGTHGTCCPFPAGLSKQVWLICSIVLAATVA